MRKRLSRRVSIAILAVGLLLLLYVGAVVIANKQLTRMLPGTLAEAVGGRDADRYSVTVGDVALSYSLRGVRISDLRVELDSTRTAETEEPALIRAANLGLLRVSGLRLIPLLMGEGIFVSNIVIEGPTISLDFSAAAPAPAVAETADSDRSASRAAPNASLRRVQVRNGSVDVARPTEYGTLVSFLRNLDLDLSEIRIDSVTLADPDEQIAALETAEAVLAAAGIEQLDLDDEVPQYGVSSRRILQAIRQSECLANFQTKSSARCGASNTVIINP